MTPAQLLLATAQHEAAHVVVGVALGLRMREAVIGEAALVHDAAGYVWFRSTIRDREALACMFSAGPAWERLMGCSPERIAQVCAHDVRMVRSLSVGARGAETFIRVATALLERRQAAHARVTRALLDVSKITGADVERIARGEPLERDD